MSWTLFEYRYRDAGNFKANGAVALEGRVTEADEQGARAALDGGELFIAEQLDIPPLYKALYQWSGGPTSDDHCWHEFVAFTPVEEDEVSPAIPRLGSASAFIKRFQAVREWRCDLSPMAACAFDEFAQSPFVGNLQGSLASGAGGGSPHLAQASDHSRTLDLLGADGPDAGGAAAARRAHPDSGKLSAAATIVADVAG